MPPLPSSLLAALNRGAPVVAPTALSAGILRARYDAHQRSARLAVWQPANVLSWQQWLSSLWTSLVLTGHETRLLLNPAQEDLLWRDILLPSLDPANHASAPAFAQLARSAFALAAGYNITLARLASSAQTEDTEQFARWAADFTRVCGRHGYLPAAQLPAALREHLTRRAFAAPAELHLAGFAPGLPDLPPADADFLEALHRAGTKLVEHPPTTGVPITRQTLQARTESAELRALAHWLRNVLDAHIAAHPQAGPTRDLPTIHVVLAGPSPDPAALDSIFREVLAPELDHITADPAAAPWEHAAGRPLAAQPIVTTLVRLLQGLARPLALDDITALLLSPYLGRTHDRDAAAQLDAWILREHPPLRPELTLRELSSQVHQSRNSAASPAAPDWLRPLLTLLQSEGNLATLRTHAAWSTFVRDVAAAVSWPGAAPLTPLEFAATQSWDHLLDSLAPLDFTGRRVPFAEALAALNHQLQSATVALATNPPIRILSATEAAATPCDVLVLAQATDTNWPPATRPHPLLPWPVQAAAGMPGAHPVRDAARAQRLTDALLAATPHVLLTHAAQAHDAPQRLAPSLRHRAQSQTDPAWQELSLADLIPVSAPLVIAEELVDDIPLPPLPGPHVSGGATVLQLQAACGFRAFAELRLRSIEPRSPGLGVDAGRAGSLLHHALDVFWKRVRSQSTLRSLPGDELDEHLQAAIQHAFTRLPSSDHPWDKAYRALQMERLFELLKSWMSFETQRSSFTVLDIEQKRHLTVGPLELDLRVDRVDALDDGSGTLLIDYKTGYDARPAAWQTERPDQPQLPLYTLLPNPARLRGLAFARIRRGQFAWAGFQEEAGLLGSARVNLELQELVAAWRTVLTHLAEQFAAGDHSVNPKSYPATCARCGQRALCRLDPNTLLAASADADEHSELEEEAALG